MNTGDLLTVKEFAAAAGVTVQAIYPRIKGDLKPYFKEENGQKLIDKAGLEIFIKSVPLKDFKELENNFKELEKSFKETLNQIKELEKQLEIKENETAGKDKLIETQAAEIETLKQELAAKNTQISLLQADNAQQLQSINNLTAALTAAQTLQAMEKQERLQLTQGGHDQSGGDLPPETSGNSSRENAADQSGNDTKAAPEPVKKKSLLDRLNPFKRK